MLLQEASESWDFQNVYYGTSALAKIYIIVLFAICVKEQGSSTVSRTTGRPAEILRAGSGIEVDGTAALNQHIY